MAAMDKEKNFVSVVAYVHEVESLPAFLLRIAPVMERSFEHYEVILVDDAAVGWDTEKVRKQAALLCDGTLQIIHMSYFHGVELSMDAGMELAIGDFVFEFDDIVLDYAPELVMQIYHRCLEGYDIVKAVPQNGGRYSSRWFYRLYNHFSRNEYPLQTERFRILSRRAINRIHAMNLTIPYRKALYANCGLPQDALPYESKGGPLTAMDTQARQLRWQTALDALILFTDAGWRIAFLLAAGMVGVSILMGLYALFMFFDQRAITGWTSMILFLSVGFAGLFAVAAILMKYLDVLLGLVFKRRSYMVEGIEKLTH